VIQSALFSRCRSAAFAISPALHRASPSPAMSSTSPAPRSRRMLLRTCCVRTQAEKKSKLPVCHGELERGVPPPLAGSKNASRHHDSSNFHMDGSSRFWLCATEILALCEVCVSPVLAPQCPEGSVTNSLRCFWTHIRPRVRLAVGGCRSLCLKAQSSESSRSPGTIPNSSLQRVWRGAPRGHYVLLRLQDGSGCICVARASKRGRVPTRHVERVVRRGCVVRGRNAPSRNP